MTEPTLGRNQLHTRQHNRIGPRRGGHHPDEPAAFLPDIGTQSFTRENHAGKPGTIT